MLSRYRPRPSMEQRAPAASTRAVKATLVNCDPWSVLKISGTPRRSAASSASMQKALSIVFDKRQDRTCRLAQSITATR